MRLIDADALIQKRNHAKAYAQDMYVIGQGYVMDAPTIDAAPVVRGEWIEHEYEMECPQCGYFWNYCDNDTERFNYCPNCGCDMRGERDGEK